MDLSNSWYIALCYPETTLCYYSPSNPVEMLNSLLMSDGGDNFEKFKTVSLEENSFYPLLIRIMTKLPFVHYIAQDNQLDSLDQFIKNNLSQFDNNLLSYICDNDHVFSDDLINQKISTDWNLL